MEQLEDEDAPITADSLSESSDVKVNQDNETNEAVDDEEQEEPGAALAEQVMTKGQQRRINKFQKRLGSLIDKFVEEPGKAEFSLDNP